MTDGFTLRHNKGDCWRRKLHMAAKRMVQKQAFVHILARSLCPFLLSTSPLGSVPPSLSIFLWLTLGGSLFFLSIFLFYYFHIPLFFLSSFKGVHCSLDHRVYIHCRLKRLEENISGIPPHDFLLLSAALTTQTFILTTPSCIPVRTPTRNFPFWLIHLQRYSYLIQFSIIKRCNTKHREREIR